MTLEEYRQRYGAEDAVGWQCIDRQLAKVYGERGPRHDAAPLHYIAGGLDPLDGTSYYDDASAPHHIHVVSYGLSELYYNEEAVGQEFSKAGFELTFRLKRNEGDTVEPTWVSVVMNNLARYVHKSGRWFKRTSLFLRVAPCVRTWIRISLEWSSPSYSSWDGWTRRTGR